MSARNINLHKAENESRKKRGKEIEQVLQTTWHCFSLIPCLLLFNILGEFDCGPHLLTIRTYLTFILFGEKTNYYESVKTVAIKAIKAIKACYS